MLHLASPENDRQSDFVAFGEEFAHVLDFDFQVMAADFGPHPKLFDLPALVLFAGFLQFLFAFVTKFGKIRQFAYRRVIESGDLDQV